MATIRITEAQALKLGDPRPGLNARVGGVAKLSEADVTRQCIDWLRVRGWRCIRLQSGLAKGHTGGYIRLGEDGLPDYIVCKPERLFFLELKRPGGKRRPSQIRWHETATSDGFRILTVDSLQCFVDRFMAEIEPRGEFVEARKR